MDVHGGPRVAVLGCGNWGRNHLRAWADLGHLALACDVEPGKLDEVAAAYPGVELSGSPEAVMARPDIDAVVIATPAPTHARLAQQAIAAGKDVLVEKPIALDVGEAEDLVEAASAASVVLMVGHVLEYHPAFVKLGELIGDGELGKVLYAYSHRLNFGTVRISENAMWSFAPHDVALLLRMLGTMPEDVSCQGGSYLNAGVADVTVMNLRFPGGVRAHVFVSWLHPFKEHRFIVVGDKQMAVVDDTAPWEEKLLLYPHTVQWLDGSLPTARRAEAIAIPLEAQEPLRAECEHFLGCIASRQAPLTDGASGVRVLRLLEAAEASMKEGAVAPGRAAGTGEVAPPQAGHVDPTATVDPGAVVGEGTRLWHYSHVMSGAEVGRHCVLGQNTFVGAGVRMGDRVRVQNNVSLYDGVVLEDDVFCGPSAVFTNVRNPRSEVDRKDQFETTIVRRGATLGANSTVVCGVTIGEYALVGAGAVVTKDVPDHALVVGVPARVVGWVCQCGERMEFSDDRARCAGCGRRYQSVDGRSVAVDD